MPPCRATSANASRVRGCKGPRIPPRMSTISTGGSERASTRLRQLQPLELVPALGTGRGGPAEEHRAGLRGSAAGDLAGVVARVSLLLVGGVVLLIDHDQARIGHRSEDRRARPDADPGLTRTQASPFVIAGTRGHLGVEQRDGVTESPPEAVHRLRRQGDLRDEDDRSPPPRQRLPGRLEVDLRLARAGHAVEQIGGARRSALLGQGRDH